MKVTAFFIRFVTDILFQSRCVTFQAVFPSLLVLNYPRWSPGFVPEKGLFPFPGGFLPHFRNSVRPHSPDIKQDVFWIMDSDLNHFFGFVSKRHFLIFLFLDWSQFGSVSCCVYSVIVNPQKLPSDQSCGSEICKFKMYRLDFWSILKSITWLIIPRDTILSSFKLNHAN